MIAYFFIGMVLGGVLLEAEAISWFRIQEMFRFEAFQMYGIIGSAVAVATVSLQMIRRLGFRSWGGEPIALAPKNIGTGARYAIGGCLFGLGWALTGACPGPLVVLIAGGMPERSADPKRVHNTLVALDPDGRVAASYRKIHLFDVDIPGGAQFTESATVAPGAEAVVLSTPFCEIGLSICYDLRFPELYRRLVEKGATVVVVPAAFTQHTGKDHWHALLRARAIENQVYVLAAGQFGRHSDKRVTYGHSLVVDPWGTIIAEASDQQGVIVTPIDLEFQAKVRRELPCLSHRRM